MSLFGWLIREQVPLAGLCERKILFRLKIYDRLRQATAKPTGCIFGGGNNVRDLSQKESMHVP